MSRIEKDKDERHQQLRLWGDFLATLDRGASEEVRCPDENSECEKCFADAARLVSSGMVMQLGPL